MNEEETVAEEPAQEGAANMFVFAVRTPWVTYLIGGLCLLLYVAELVFGDWSFEPDTGAMYHLGGFIASDVTDGGWWRMFTSGFLHGGPVHLVMNVICLFQLGLLYERLAGNAMMAFTFLLATFGGSVACALAYDSNVVCIGASGGVFGLASALIVFLLMAHMGIRTAQSCLSFVGVNLLFSLAPGVSMAAHVGGLLAGLPLGALAALSWRARMRRLVSGVSEETRDFTALGQSPARPASGGLAAAAGAVLIVVFAFWGLVTVLPGGLGEARRMESFRTSACNLLVRGLQDNGELTPYVTFEVLPDSVELMPTEKEGYYDGGADILFTLKKEPDRTFDVHYAFTLVYDSDDETVAIKGGRTDDPAFDEMCRAIQGR